MTAGAPTSLAELEVKRPDRVAWPCIRPGWRVVAADGTEVGQIDEVAGDVDRDIFDGLAIATAALGKPRYVLADQVGEISDGLVRLTIGVLEVQRLREYLEPATSTRLVADDGRGVRAALRAIARSLAIPLGRRERALGLRLRVAHLIRRWRR